MLSKHILSTYPRLRRQWRRILHVIIILLIILVLGIYISIILNYSETDFHTPIILKDYHEISINDVNYKSRMLVTQKESQQNKLIRFGAYVALPFFYIKSGDINTGMTGSSKDLLSIATFCDLNLLPGARELAINYQSGPISIAIYVNKDYNSHSIHSFMELKELLEKTFADIHNRYNIIIGLLYHDEASPFYIKKGFTESTPMMFKLPNNALRNLAERQVATTWLMNIDIDFIYFSDSFSSQKLAMTLKQLNDITNKPEIGDKTMFIVPSFETIHKDLSSVDVANRYQSLTKKQLMEYIIPKNKALRVPEIAPFYANMEAQKCTNYTKWYTRNEEEFSYFIKYENERNCTWHYEPFYIINTKISRLNEYKWDNTFVGKGLNKVERTFTLRHYCFNFYVLNDLFIIHRPDSLRWDGIDKNHTKISVSDKEKWHKSNQKLFNNKKSEYFADKESCAFYSKSYYWFWTQRAMSP